MQVLYQLSYGPVRIDGWPGAGRLDWPAGRAVRWRKLTPQGVRPSGTPDTGCHTWRQTATSLPWMLT